jgi:signal transduction histidine kinase
VVPLNANRPLQAPPPRDVRWLRAEDVSAVAACRNAALSLPERLRFPAARADELALAVTEAASSLHKHAAEGALWLGVNRDGDPPGIDLVTIDAGPGLPDVTAAMRDGHSTAGTPGIGLGVIQRLADSCALYSRPGRGTALAARFRLPGATSPAAARWSGPIRPVDGETECGDAYAADAITAVMCGGLGRGPLAAAAAAAGVAAFLDDPSGDPAALLERVHRRMAAPAAGPSASSGSGTAARAFPAWATSRPRSSPRARKSMTSIPGIAGHQARTIRAFDYELPPGAAVVLHSDGISARWEAAARPGLETRDPLLSAAVLLAEAGIHRDDAGILVLKAMTSQLARLEVRDADGVFAARQLGRGLAALLELDHQDQVRAATALGEISRSVVTAGLRSVMTFVIDEAELVVTVTVDGTPPSDAVGPAGRLMDRVTVEGSVVRMTKRRPPGVQPDRRLVSEQLVNDLLDVAKAESGQLHTDPAQVDLAALPGRLRGLARPMAADKAATVDVRADGDPRTPATILTDEVALTGILRNLLSNGIKYTDRGEVRLSVRVNGPRLEIIVADTGIGIPAGLTSHVFEEFYQVPGVRRGGTGLGLPYARRLARILGGDLTLASEPGAGTTVVLDLPLARLPTAVPAVTITSADLRPPARAAALLRKDELTRERLEFTIRAVIREVP